MRSLKIIIFFFAFTCLLTGCKHKTSIKKSNFKISRDYTQFSTKMENNDTLNITVDLSICMGRGYDRLQITKSNDSVYLQIREKVIENDTFHFKKVHYQLKNDTLSLERMIADFDMSYKYDSGFPFFVISNPKEKNKIVLQTTGLNNRNFNLRRYENIMHELYPKEMRKFLTPIVISTTDGSSSIKHPEKTILRNIAIDTSKVFGIWTQDPNGPHADFSLTAKSFYVVDYDGNGNMPYILNKDKITIFYDDFTQTGKIISAENDTLKIRWEDSTSATQYVKFKN